MREHAFEANACAMLLSQQVQDVADHSVADERIIGIRAFLCESAKAFRRLERGFQLRVVELGRP